MSSSEIVNDKKLVFNYPFLVLSDNNNICKTWEKALEDTSFKAEYNLLNEKDKKNIEKNLQSRTCQTINNIKQCFTTSGKLETCSEIKKDNPNNMSNIMAKISKDLSNKKKKDIKKLDDETESRTTLINNLITQYTNRKEMLNMNDGYHNTIDESINKRRQEETELGDNIEKINNLKEFTQEDIKDERSGVFWYQSKNKIINKIIRYLLIIFLCIIIIHILLLPYYNSNRE
jgi:hypothetical protein